MPTLQLTTQLLINLPTLHPTNQQICRKPTQPSQTNPFEGGLVGWFHTTPEKSLSPLEWTLAVSPKFI
jgi:hypothetical protein